MRGRVATERERRGHMAEEDSEKTTLVTLSNGTNVRVKGDLGDVLEMLRRQSFVDLERASDGTEILVNTAHIVSAEEADVITATFIG
jgi:hypothetical protein